MSSLIWDRDGVGWPNREVSRFVGAAGLKWHVQDFGGAGPVLLLVHGTGASTHSWRRFAPLLRSEFRVVAFDLPGHGFTSAPSSQSLTLSYMADAVTGLLRQLDIAPNIAAGHSAGAAILAQMSLHANLDTRAIVSLNGALLPFGGFASQLFPALARLLFLNPFVPSFFAWRANGLATVKRLIEGTGSAIDEDGLKLYARLFQSSGHVAAALGMMANWDLAALAADLPRLAPHLLLVAGSEDKAIPPDAAFTVRDLVPRSQVALLRGLGHLAHEEHPELVAPYIVKAANDTGLLPLPEVGRRGGSTMIG